MVSVGQSKKTLVLLCVVFVLPVILAKIALEQDWFNKASTNRGTLLSPVIDASQLLGDEEKRWRVLYVVPSQCHTRCENAIYSIQQIDTALGKESDRTNATLILTNNSDNSVLQDASTRVAFEVLNYDSKNVNKVFDPKLQDGIFLIDTLNNAMMHYALFEEREAAIMQSRDVLSDLKKMLKLSRIG